MADLYYQRMLKYPPEEFGKKLGTDILKVMNGLYYFGIKGEIYKQCMPAPKVSSFNDKDKYVKARDKYELEKKMAMKITPLLAFIHAQSPEEREEILMDQFGVYQELMNRKLKLARPDIVTDGMGFPVMEKQIVRIAYFNWWSKAFEHQILFLEKNIFAHGYEPESVEPSQELG